MLNTTQGCSRIKCENGGEALRMGESRMLAIPGDVVFKLYVHQLEAVESTRGSFSVLLSVVPEFVTGSLPAHAVPPPLDGT